MNLVPDMTQVESAVMSWLDYKTSQATSRSLQEAGFATPMTSPREFIARLNAASRRAVNGLGITHPMECRALAEILMNAADNMDKQAENPGWSW